MDIVVEFRGCKGVGVESNGVDFIVHWRYHGEDGSKGVVQHIHFDYEWRACNPVHQHWCGGEGFLQCVESGAAFVREILSGALAGEVGEQNGDVRVVQNETPVEISKTQEGLYVFNLAGLRPILNDLYFIGCHGKSTQREDVT